MCFFENEKTANYNGIYIYIINRRESLEIWYYIYFIIVYMENIKTIHPKKMNTVKPIEFTEDDLDNCWAYYKSYLVDILNGTYPLEEARDDLRGLIGSEFDKRIS